MTPANCSGHWLWAITNEVCSKDTLLPYEVFLSQLKFLIKRQLTKTSVAWQEELTQCQILK